MRAATLLLLFPLAGCLSDITPSHQAPPGAGGVGSGGGNPDPAGPMAPLDPQCGKQTFPITVSKKTANVMLIVDESGSMSDIIAGSTPPVAKWDALKSAVSDVMAKANWINWGLSIFPAVGAADSCAPGIVDVAIAHGNEATINGKLTAISAASLAGATPTAETFLSVTANGKLDDPSHDNYILILTDGVPTCAPDTQVAPAIKALYQRTPSVRTFVVGIGAETQGNPTLLNSWATEGHTARMNVTPAYYQVNTVGDLATSLDSVIGSVASCTYSLGSQKPADPSLVTAYLDGKVVPIDPANGASYDAMSNSLLFHGSACDKIKSGAATKVDIIYGCPSPTIQ